MTPACPRCKGPIASEDVNVAKDMAHCRACNLVHTLSELRQAAELEAETDLNAPPAGAWIRREGRGITVGASHRSVGSAVVLLFFSLFWNGIVSVFVLVAIASSLRLAGIPMPEWFPAPKMNGSMMGLGMTIFMWLFLTPFILIGLAMLAGFVSCLGGRTEAKVSPAEGLVFVGVGNVGWRRRFDPRLVKDVRLENETWRDSDGDRRSKSAIRIENQDGKEIKFGSALTPERRKFVTAALRKALRA